jgi:hypothetical protein
VTSAGAASFGATAVGGNLALTAGGAVTQSAATALTVTGTTSLAATGQAITLANAGNDFGGAVTVAGGVTQIVDANTLTLGTLATGALTLTSTGALDLGQGTVGGSLDVLSRDGVVVQRGRLSVLGATTVDAVEGTVTLLSANEFGGTVTIKAGGVEVAAEGQLRIDVRTGGDAAVSSGSDTLVSGKVGGTARLLSGRDLVGIGGDAQAPDLEVGGLLDARALRNIGSPGAALVVQTGSFSARSAVGGIHIREIDDLVIVDEIVTAAGEGEIDLTSAGSISMGASARVMAADGGVTLSSAGDIAVAEVASKSGPVRVDAGGALRDSSQGQALHFSTPARLSLSAQRGIGGVGVALLRMDAGEVEAVNGDIGDVIVAGRAGLKAAGQGFRNDAAEGWTALLAMTGSLDPGRVESRSGRVVMLVGRTTISASDLVIRRTPLDDVATQVPVSMLLDASPRVAQDTSAVLQAGLEAVSRGLLVSSGNAPLIAVMGARPEGPAVMALPSGSAVAPTPAALSSALQPVSDSKPQSGAEAGSATRPVRETRSEATPAPAAADAPAATSVPAAPAVAPGTGTTAPLPEGGAPAPAAPDAAPAVQPAAPAGNEGASPSGQGGVDADPAASTGADANSTEASGLGEGVEASAGLRARWAAAYAGWSERISRWFERSAEPVVAVDARVLQAPAQEMAEGISPGAVAAPGASSPPTTARTDGGPVA